MAARSADQPPGEQSGDDGQGGSSDQPDDDEDVIDADFTPAS